jgi:hypothetical protein
LNSFYREAFGVFNETTLDYKWVHKSFKFKFKSIFFQSFFQFSSKEVTAVENGMKMRSSKNWPSAFEIKAVYRKPAVL